MERILSIFIPVLPHTSSQIYPTAPNFLFVWFFLKNNPSSPTCADHRHLVIYSWVLGHPTYSDQPTSVDTFKENCVSHKNLQMYIVSRLEDEHLSPQLKTLLSKLTSHESFATLFLSNFEQSSPFLNYSPHFRVKLGIWKLTH